MTKDKQLTFLIEEEKRDRLKEYCADLGLTISQVLTNYVDDLLSGSTQIETSTYTPTSNLYVQEQVEIAIDKLEPKLVDIIFNPTNVINTKLKEHDDDIHELENSLYTCQTMLRTLTELVSKKGIGNVELDPTTKQALAHTVKPQQSYKTQSSDEMYLDDKIRTLKDTQTLITNIYRANLSTTVLSARTSQDGISNILNNGNYPHPNKRKWTRDEVRKVCKLFGIATK